MLVLVGSKNPIKIAAAKAAFGTTFSDTEVTGIAVDSGVSQQPIGEETYRGARNRALTLRRINREQGLQAHYFVGIEGGVSEIAARWFAFGCMCIMDDNGRIGFGTSSLFQLPQSIGNRITRGEELGQIIDDLTGQRNTKVKQGAVGFLTGGRIDRTQLYQQGIQLALIPFINQQLYANDEA